MSVRKISKIAFANRLVVAACLTLLLLMMAAPVHAYIGPGAGFAFISSLLTLFLSFLLAFFALLMMPVRLLLSFLRSGKGLAHAKFKRIVILGFDGLDPDLCDEYMAQGYLQNFSQLKKDGSFKRLQSTCPPLSPVAWSSFATGVNPAKHRIFDFLHRNVQTYLPELSSSQVSETKKKLRFGDWQIPLGRPKVQFLRKSQSFWKILGERGIFSHIIRVPITFPPEKFNGLLLSAMCTPDLLGTQGSFAFYTSAKNAAVTLTGGFSFPLEKNARGYHGVFIGPENNQRRSATSLKLDFYLVVEDQSATLRVKGKKYLLSPGQLSEWIPVIFKAGFGQSARGICQVLLKATEPDVQLYVSPINIDPERPAMPISFPYSYAVYLAKLFGSYATLGLAEDTWALNEGILDGRAFLDQVYGYQKEREAQFFHALKQNRRGLVACVFDATDRVQHTFFHYLDKNHPGFQENAEFKNAIRDVYIESDKVLGRTLQAIKKDTLLLVMSDHGFKSFRRGLNVNTWLKQHGYLFTKPDGKNEYLQSVDWSKTTAYAIGLAGIYLNRFGREKQGIVSEAEVEALKQKLLRELGGLRDPKTGEIAVRTLYDFEKVNHGPYAAEAPDLIVGYNPGYRISWDGAVGKITDEIFEDNTKAWSGDHGIDPAQVPGALFSNCKIDGDQPHIMDIAPTVLDLFGIRAPEYMDGKAIRIEKTIEDLRSKKDDLRLKIGDLRSQIEI